MQGNVPLLPAAAAVAAPAAFAAAVSAAAVAQPAAAIATALTSAPLAAVTVTRAPAVSAVPRGLSFVQVQTAMPQATRLGLQVRM